MALHQIRAWGPWSPWPAEDWGEGPISFTAADSTTFFTSPKRVTTERTCPNCGDRGTKIICLSATDPEKYILCQCCRQHYAPPPPSVRRPRRILRSNRDWMFA